VSNRGRAIQSKNMVFRMSGERREAILALVGLAERHITEARDMIEAGSKVEALILLESGIVDFWNLRAALKKSDLPD